MLEYEYIKILFSEIPQEIVDKYRLDNIVHNEYVYVQIQKDIPGLKQVGNIDNQRLTKHLAKSG